MCLLNIFLVYLQRIIVEIVNREHSPTVHVHSIEGGGGVRAVIQRVTVTLQ